jgi:hypothetical protein
VGPKFFAVAALAAPLSALAAAWMSQDHLFDPGLMIWLD